MKNEPADARRAGLCGSGRRRVSAIVLLAVFMAAPAWAGAEPEADLIVQVSGFKYDRGQAVANLFREGDDIFGKPHARVAAPIVQGKSTLVFAHLPLGAYAVTAFHDENGNNDLDHNILRFPAEPLGFSNAFRLSLFSGMPSFEKLRFVFDAASKPLEITVK